MSKPVLALLAAVVAIGMIAAGCGSSSDESTSSLTKAEFVKQGNAICAKGNEAISGEFEEFAKEHHISEKQQPSKAVLAEASEQILIPAVSSQLEELRELAPPSGEEKKVDQFLTAAEEGIEKGEEDPNSLTSESAGPFAKADKLAAEYGLVKCGEG